MEQIKKIIAILGAGLLVYGCFLPIITTPGNTSVFLDTLPSRLPDIPQNALKYCAAIFIGIAVIAAGLALMRSTKFLWTGGLVSGSFLVCVYWGMKIKIDQMKEESDRDLDKLFGGMFKSVAQSLFDKVQIAGAGWYVIGAGSLLLILSTMLQTNNINETNK